VIDDEEVHSEDEGSGGVLDNQNNSSASFEAGFAQ